MFKNFLSGRVNHVATLLGAALGMLLSGSVGAANVTLAWDASPGPNTIVGYKIYYGPTTGNYTNSVAVGNVTTTTVSNLVAGGLYFFAATAQDELAQESDYSVEISYRVAAPVINQPPTLDPILNLTINENAGAQVVSLKGISPGATNENQTLTVTASSSNPGLIPNPTVTYTSPNATGLLSFTPVTFGFGIATITVTVNDGQAINNTITRTFTVTVNAVNQTPTLAALSDMTLVMNDPEQKVNLGGITTGAPNEKQTLSITATSSNPALIPHPTVTYTSPDASGSLAFKPVTGAYGVARITVTVNDGGDVNSTVSRSFQVTVDRPPTISTVADKIIAMDSKSPALAFTIDDLDTPLAALTVSAQSSNPSLVPAANVVLAGTGANRTVTVTPVMSKTGFADVTLTVSDGLAAASTTFRVTVAPRPAPPGNLRIALAP